MPLYIAQSGDLDRCDRCLTDSLTTLKDRATQLLIKYMSGALVTQRQRQDIYLFLFDFYDRKGCICCFLTLLSHDTTFRAEKYHEQAFTGIIHFKVTKGIQSKSGITMGSHASEVLS